MARSHGIKARQVIKVRSKTGNVSYTETIGGALKRASENFFVNEIEWTDVKTGELIVLKRNASFPDDWRFTLRNEGSE